MKQNAAIYIKADCHCMEIVLLGALINAKLFQCSFLPFIKNNNNEILLPQAPN